MRPTKKVSVPKPSSTYIPTDPKLKALQMRYDWIPHKKKPGKKAYSLGKEINDFYKGKELNK